MLNIIGRARRLSLGQRASAGRYPCPTDTSDLDIPESPRRRGRSYNLVLSKEGAVTECDVRSKEELRQEGVSRGDYPGEWVRSVHEGGSMGTSGGYAGDPVYARRPWTIPVIPDLSSVGTLYNLTRSRPSSRPSPGSSASPLL